MRVLLAEDHALVRAGIHALVAALPNVTEVLEAVDGHEALAAVTEHRPDVVLMDITMPRMNGLEATLRILKQSPRTRVIILSMHRSEELVWRAFRAGACGYLVKTGAAVELQHALRAVERGQKYVSPSLQQSPVDFRAELSPLEQLTPRQREVLQLIAEGLTSRQIADALQIHVKTVDSHRTQLLKRLDIHDIAGVVRFAIRNCLVSSD
jgi:DNA-binding NarL/FixJ family response regulator